MQISNIESLLTRVSDLNKKYDQITKISGENFNIFKILKIQSNEVLTHSPFLAELFNPKGLHGCKDAFLKIFFSHLKEIYDEENLLVKTIDKFETETTEVSIERFLGFKNEDETEGGRIDILLKDQLGNTIIIENKIFAKDQTKQLVRYNSAYPTAPIIYLTLSGKKPSDFSSSELKENEHYYCLSYNTQVVNWLEQCIKEASTFPFVRETIHQYLYLIKSLTGQTLNNFIMNETIEKIIESKEAIEAAFIIADSQELIKKSLITILKEQLREKSLKLSFNPIDDHFGEGIDNYYHFYLPETNHKTSICIGFEKDRRDFCLGLYMDDYKTEIDFYTTIKPILVERIAKTGMGRGESDKYLNWAYIYYFKDDLRDWSNNKDIWVGIKTGEVSNRLMKIVVQVYESIKDMDL